MEAGAFAYSPFAVNKAAIYVPDKAVTYYKSHCPCRHLYFPMSSYPVANIATVTDTWAQIVAASSDGTYDSKYSVGDTAWLQIDGKDYLFELIGKDVDELSDNSGKAHMTWLMVNV